MSLKYDIRKFVDLHERLPLFAEITSELVQTLDLEKGGGRGPKAEPASDRLIRDYVRRRVLSPTLRGADSDERGYYGFRHLVEFLAARVLLNDGWPLEKIAERNSNAATEDLLRLIPGQPEENEALALARSFRRADRDDGGGVEDGSATSFSGLVARRRAELPMLMRQITGTGSAPNVRQRVMFDFGERLTLLIDQDWLRRMNVGEADVVGRAISAALVDYPNLNRGKETK